MVKKKLPPKKHISLPIPPWWKGSAFIVILVAIVVAGGLVAVGVILKPQPSNNTPSPAENPSSPNQSRKGKLQIGEQAIATITPTPTEVPYAQSTYYSESTYIPYTQGTYPYNQSSYYSQSTYGYSESSYYTQSNYYLQSAYQSAYLHE